MPLPRDYPVRIAVHPDGRLVAVASLEHGGNPARLYLCEEGKQPRALLARAVEDVAFRPDGGALAVGMSGASCVLDLKGKVLWQTAEGSTTVAWLPDGRAVMSGVGIVDSKSKKIVKLTPAIGWGRGFLCVGPDTFATTIDGNFQAWDFQGKAVRTLEVPRGGEGNSLAVMAPDGRVFVGWNGKNKASLYGTAPRFAVVTTASKPGKVGRPKQTLFDTREAAEDAARGVVAAHQRKGYALAGIAAGMTAEERQEAARWQAIEKSKAKKLVRPAWRPRTVARDHGHVEQGFRASARLGEGESWPVCPSCSHPLDLFLQLNLSETPNDQKGILQVFYCTSTSPLCEVETEAFFAGPGKSKLVRIVDPASAPRVAPRPKELAKRVSAPPLEIVGWDAVKDAPCEEELEHLAKRSLEELGVAALWDGLPQGGDKLGGYPAWQQSVEYPTCAECKKPMDRALFQLGSNGAAAWQWGDMGTAYLVQCSRHPGRLELLWQGG